jgi:hypothetical protein
MKQSFYILLAPALFLSCSKQDRLPTQTAPASNIVSQNGIFNFSSYMNSALKSAEKTFGQRTNVAITRIEEEQIGNSNVQTIYYRTAKGQESTFIVVQPYSATVKKVTIDCYGTCDCRERVILDSQGNPTAYECTCSQCKMDVITDT